MAKRGNREGSPRWREKEQRWEWSVRLGPGIRRYVYGKTKAEAREKYEALKREYEQGLDLGAPAQTIETFLDRWMTDVVHATLRPRTADYYAGCIKKYINPAIGKVQLNKLTPQHVQRMVNGIPKDLAPRTVRNIRAILRRALSYAVTWRLVTYNAAQGVAMPKIEKYQSRIPTVDEAARFRAAIKDIRLEALYLLAMGLGLRRGEALGLLKENIDFEKREMHITGQVQLIRGKVERVSTKTEASRRTLPIPDVLRRWCCGCCWSSLTTHYCSRQRPARPFGRAIWCGSSRSCCKRLDFLIQYGSTTFDTSQRRRSCRMARTSRPHRRF
jgi:integrase